MKQSIKTFCRALAYFEILLWDFDGVLGLTEGPAFEALTTLLNKRLKKWGRDKMYTTEELLRRFRGTNARKILGAICQDVDLVLDEKTIDQFIADEVAGAIKKLAQEMQPTEGIRQLLERIAEIAPKVPNVVVSSSALNRLLVCCDKGGLQPFFKLRRIISVATLSLPSKPSPAGYLYAMRRWKKKSGLVIEDSEHGVTSGKAAHCTVIGYTGSMPVADRAAHRQLLLDAGADAVIEHFTELESVVIQLANRLSQQK